MRTPFTFALPLLGTVAMAAPAAGAEKPAIVLVHGAFADASGFGAVIAILQADGYRVTAVENALESYAGDVATTKRAIKAQTGPVVVVGHSYGGAVVGEAAAGEPNVKALVFLAAITPDAGEPVDAYLPKYPTELATAQLVDSAGFVTVDPAKFRNVVAGDLPAAAVAVAAASQKPILGASFDAKPAHAAWRTVPSWYVVSKQDHALSPELERFYAKRMNAHTSEIDGSHVSFISHPKEVATVIEEAAASVK